MEKKTLDFKWYANKKIKKDVSCCKDMFPTEVGRVARKFHKQIPGYKMSPLRSLPNLASMFRLKENI